jgi:hypothetical protein
MGIKTAFAVILADENLSLVSIYSAVTLEK